MFGVIQIPFGSRQGVLQIKQFGDLKLETYGRNSYALGKIDFLDSPYIFKGFIKWYRYIINMPSIRVQ